MKKPNFFFTWFTLVVFGCIGVSAQTASTSDFLLPQPPADRTVAFDTSDPGIKTPILWGLDLAWLSRDNIRRGIAFMGNDKIDIIRSSFRPTLPLIDGELDPSELQILNQRLDIIDLLGRPMNLALNSDHPSVHSFYYGNHENWAKLIDVVARHHQEKGHTIETVSPFNEPDYTATGQGTIEDFYEIAGLLKENPRFANTRISGGNTLNNDVALTWYNRLKDRLDEGNTHQLAGSFDTYAAFFTAVRANGHHATNDELHNVMEAMVGVEYGMQTGIWWGTAEYARGEFVKATHGERLAYAEHRPNWSAASVYRSPEGKIQAFSGMSERQAKTTSYRFLAKDRDVYVDGVGPLRDYTLVMPGGVNYQDADQQNAERVLQITWGEDIQPVIDGRYMIVNRNSRRVMDTADSSKDAGANVQQSNYNRGLSQRWDVNPVPDRIGGDFSYFTIKSANSGRVLDILNWSLDPGGNIIQYGDGTEPGSNQQWYLEYAEEGWFYIRSRHSSLCIEVANSSTTAGANIQQGEFKGATHQQWRFLPIGVTLDFTAPSAPAELKATPQNHSVRLDWTASPESDVAGYVIFRAESPAGPYTTIARNVTSTSFVDNTVKTGETYSYKVKAIDESLNRSEYSPEVSAAATGEHGMVLHLAFDGDTRDATENLNHAAVYGEVSYVDGKLGESALALDGTSFLQVSSGVAQSPEFTFAAWINWQGGNNLQRIFDFGNGEEESMYLTVRSDQGQTRFVMKKGEIEDRLNIPTLSSIYFRGNWGHLAVTASEEAVRMYANGEMIAESTSFTLKPTDIRPVLNYIGRSQSPDPFYNGYMDDIRIYDQALTGSEIALLANLPSHITEVNDADNELSLWPTPAKDVLHVSYDDSDSGTATLRIHNIEGTLMRTQTIEGSTTLDVSALPSGLYLLQLKTPKKTIVRKFSIAC